ncbi:MAG: acetyl-CoA C-acyltransferase FadI [Gammaproteobacteria bacterium]|nr:acetyl-CoA C-acyltransferase FadI [Gammaproteobacteria bacterium]
MASETPSTARHRVAVVAGLRTPFARERTAFKSMPARDLGKMVVAELLQRTGLDTEQVERVVFGQVIPSPQAPNIAREIVMGTGMPSSVDAYSVSRACATSYQSTTDVAESIMAGQISCAIAGGAESASDVPITVSKRLANALVDASKARSLGARLAAFKGVRFGDIVPVPPALREPSSDYTMGEAAEKMAKENGIERQAQDEFAHRSHMRANRAWDEGFFDDQVMHAYVPPSYDAFSRDNLVRADSALEAYAKLRPAFDRRYGTVTAGNSSPLTDGAGALVLMREDKAAAEGHTPLGYIKTYAYAALDPNWQMLMGPAFATPLALDRAGLALRDIDVIDMHEAFAAQILSNTRAFESRDFARERLGRDQAIGEIDWDRFNTNGGSISLGHPFAATGARQIMQALKELERTGGQFALCTACAAGGLGAAMILEAVR